MAKTKKTEEEEEPLEKKLWKAADKLRKKMDAAEYKHVALGLIFLKYISDAFEELYQKLVAQKIDGADPPKTKMNTLLKKFFICRHSEYEERMMRGDPEINDVVLLT